MLKAHQIMLETDVVAVVDTRVSDRERSAWIRQAMQLRLMIEGAANAHDHPAGQWAREILALAERGETQEATR